MLELHAPEWGEDPARRDRFAGYMRTSASPKQARRLLKMSIRSELAEVLPHVQAPTLVLAPEEGRISPLERVREFAALIPGAELREISGTASIYFAIGADFAADLIEEFVTGRSPMPATNRALASVLFTDLVGSTERAQEASA